MSGISLPLRGWELKAPGCEVSSEELSISTNALFTPAKRGMLEGMGSFFQGLGLAFTGIRTAMRSGPLRSAYLRYVGAVLLLALTLEIAVWLYLAERIPQWVESVGSWTPSAQALSGEASWWQRSVATYYDAQAATLRGITWTLAAVTWFIAATVAPYLAFVIINAVVPMFNEAIFMGALQEVDIPLHSDLAGKKGRPIYTSISYSMLRLGRFLLGTLFIALLGFIPMLGSVLAPLLSAIWTAFNLSWELLEPFFDRRGDNWKSQRELLAAHRSLRLGFATPVALLLAIPIVGIFFFAMAQASAATLASRIDGKELDLPRQEPAGKPDASKEQDQPPADSERGATPA